MVSSSASSAPFAWASLPSTSEYPIISPRVGAAPARRAAASGLAAIRSRGRPLTMRQSATRSHALS